jgi:5'-nucleotidase
MMNNSNQQNYEDGAALDNFNKTPLELYLENNPNHKKRIALDMDEVIADVYPKFLDYYERDFGERPDKSVWWGKKIYQLPNAAHIRTYLHEEGFFADLPVMEGAQEVVKWLTEHFDVFAVTAATEFRNSLRDKLDWLEEHFPFIGWQKLVLCGDKSIIQADYMIDDHPFNLVRFKGKGLLFTATHNLDENRFTRVDTWADVRTFFETELKLKGQASVAG